MSHTLARIVPFVLLAGVLPSVGAQVTHNFDYLDWTDRGDIPPEHLFIVDVGVDVAQTDVWTACGIRGECFGGARLVYAMDPNNPNQPVLTNPGNENRFVTCISKPRGRFSRSRFTSAFCALAGAYSPPGSTAVATETLLNVAFFSSPPETAYNPSVDGYIARIAIDLSGVPNLAGTELAPLSEARAGSVPLFLSDNVYGNPGTVSTTFDVPQIQGADWGVFGWLDSDATPTGDLDHDCDVDLQDMTILLAHFGTPSGGDAKYEDGDLFGDGGVDLTDLGAFLSFFGDTCP